MSQVQLKPRVTQALIIANVAMFVVELLQGASLLAPAPRDLFRLGGSVPAAVLDGQWWRLGSSMFLHAGVIHITTNMVCLYQARIVEAIFGHARMLAIYLAAGLGGGVACLFFSPANVVVVGASGAVFGIYGAFATFLLLRRAQIPPEVWQPLVRSLGSFFLLNLVIGVSIPGISLTAHIGGLVVGSAVAALLLLIKRRPAAAGPGAER